MKILEYTRSRQNQLANAVVEKILRGRDARGEKRSMRSPCKPNAGVTGLGKIFCVAGKGMVLASATMEVIDIATSDEPARSAVAAGGRLAGALAGFEAGELLCAWGGPWGVGICGFIGGVVGALGGGAAVEDIQKRLANWRLTDPNYQWPAVVKGCMSCHGRW